jgi:hypothetical protein
LSLLEANQKWQSRFWKSSNLKFDYLAADWLKIETGPLARELNALVPW